LTTPAAPEAGKRALRAELRRRRRALPAPARIAAAEALPAHLRQQPAFTRPGFIAGYWACAGEMPLHAVQLALHAEQTWCLPVVQADGRLRFAPWRPGLPLVANRYGIPEPDLPAVDLLEPEQLSVVLLPLLGFTRRGQRLGAGGGYYDRSFAFRGERPAPPALIGVGYGFQACESLPADPWDVRLDAVATEHELIVCGG
jgi:5-formyltetrahydrofolate cyclo-ligase